MPCRMNLHQPEPTEGKVVKPRKLSKDASKEWDRLVSTLTDYGILSPSYQSILNHGIAIYEEMLRARKAIEEHGCVYVDDKGHVRKNPISTSHENLSNQYLRCLIELGVTPSSKNKVTVGDKERQAENATSNFAKFLDRSRPARKSG